MSLILASASPQRRRLLKKLGLAFRVVPSHVSEKSPERDPRKLVVLLARRKAESVARKFPRALVLGADTIVVCRGKILVKPKNRKDSERILRLLNGRWHKVYTGVVLAAEGGEKTWTGAAVSSVKARRLGPETLSRLIGRHMDKAGAYAVQEKGDRFIERIVGPLDNVIGLPLKTLGKLLRRGRKALR